MASPKHPKKPTQPKNDAWKNVAYGGGPKQPKPATKPDATYTLSSRRGPPTSRLEQMYEETQIDRLRARLGLDEPHTPRTRALERTTDDEFVRALEQAVASRGPSERTPVVPMQAETDVVSARATAAARPITQRSAFSHVEQATQRRMASMPQPSVQRSPSAPAREQWPSQPPMPVMSPQADDIARATPMTTPYQEGVRRCSERIVAEAVRVAGGNKSKAARDLGISREWVRLISMHVTP